MQLPAHEVTSNTTLSTVIAQYRAVPDTPGPACTYSFVSNPGDLFSIDAGNGAITLTQLYNLQPNSNYTVLVRLTENQASTNAITIYTGDGVIPEPAVALALLLVLLPFYSRSPSL